VDLDAVRTFVAAADAGQFQEAAAALARAHQTSRLPRLQTSGRTRHRGLDTEMGTAISLKVMS
jgi:DNA-binding transcriptional LysR family regulator